MLTSLIIILVVLVISGVIAFVGDNVGRFAGRRHFSVFGLRPRRTAVLITSIVGVLIAALTILIMIVFSENVRVALFNLESLKKDLLSTSKLIVEKETELEDLKERYEQQINIYNDQIEAYDKLSQEFKNTQDKVNQLQASKAYLEASRAQLQNSIKGLQIKIEKAKTQSLLISVNQTIFADLISGKGKKESQIRDDIDAMLKRVKEFIERIYVSYGIESRNWQVKVNPAQKQQIINYIKSSHSESIILVVAAKNTLVGEDVEVVFKHIENKLVFSKDETIVSSVIDGSKTHKEIIGDLKKVLISVHNVALKKGMLADFQGSLGVIEYTELYKLANKIKNLGVKVKLEVKAEDNIHISGPLKITFIVRG